MLSLKIFRINRNTSGRTRQSGAEIHSSYDIFLNIVDVYYAYLRTVIGIEYIRKAMILESNDYTQENGNR